MANPDPTQQASVQSISIAFPTGLVMFVIVVTLFQFKESIPSFPMVLWGGVLALSVLMTSLLFVVAQFIRCNQVDLAKAFQGSVYTLGTMTLSLLVSSLSWFRIPVASVFAPLFVKEDVDVTLSSSTVNATSAKPPGTSAGCCTSTRTLEAVEQAYPLLEGLSYGFYSFFGMMFGIVIGNGMATTC